MIPELQKYGQIPGNLGIEAMKGTEFIKERTADDEDLFGH
jgi:hypothetical protein